MEDLIHAFGIDWRLIVIQIFNFAILMGALWYFLYTPVLNLLRDREEKIRKGVEDAEAAARSRNEAATEKQQVLSEAHREAEGIVSRATSHADVRGAEIVKAAEVRAEQTLEDAKAKAVELKHAALKESEAEITKMAVLAAEKVLNEKLGS